MCIRVHSDFAPITVAINDVTFAFSCMLKVFVFAPVCLHVHRCMNKRVYVCMHVHVSIADGLCPGVACTVVADSPFPVKINSGCMCYIRVYMYVCDLVSPPESKRH